MVIPHSSGHMSEKHWVADLYDFSKSLFSSQPQPTINNLPPEILEQIFTYYVYEPGNATPEQPLPNSFISAQSKWVANPLILGQVCGLWMAISRSRPTLWSSIHMTEPSMKHMDMVSYWLSLSAKSPLTLSLTLWNASALTGGTDASDTARRFLELLLSHYDEWQHITIHLSHENYLSSGFQGRLPRYSPPKLNYADINYGYGMMGDGPVDDAIIQFYSYPGIDSLAWCAQWYKPTSLISVFPHWKDLKHLTYRQGYSENALTVNEAVGLLVGCPVLERFDAIIYAEHGHVLDLHEPFIHPHLRVLDLTFHPDRSARIFDSISCPELEEVSIDFASIGDFGVMESAGPFLAFLERSECKLESFSFNNKGAPEDVLLDILGSPQLRHIKVLHLAGIRTKRVIDLLTRTGADPSSLSILPHLERFELKKFSYTGESLEMSADSIERMLISRTKRTRMGEGHQLSPLRYVDLSLGKLGMWGYFRLARLASHGYRIIPVTDLYLPRFVQILRGMRDWISPETGVSWER